jgi:DNA-binding response OmpR family regulator
MRRLNSGAARSLSIGHQRRDAGLEVLRSRKDSGPERPQTPLSRLTVLPVVVSRSLYQAGETTTLLAPDGLIRVATPVQPRNVDRQVIGDAGADVVMLDGRDSRPTLVYRAIVRLRNAGWSRGIVLVIRPEDLDIVAIASSIGATDFVISTASREELEARLRRAASRPANPAIAAAPQSAGGIQLIWPAHQVSFEGTTISLTLRELQLLSVLMDRGQTVTTPVDLARLAWGGKHRKAGGGLAAAYVCSLRKKLAWFGGRFGIQTVRGVGYRFII